MPDSFFTGSQVCEPAHIAEEDSGWRTYSTASVNEVTAFEEDQYQEHCLLRVSRLEERILNKQLDEDDIDSSIKAQPAEAKMLKRLRGENCPAPSHPLFPGRPRDPTAHLRALRGDPREYNLMSSEYLSPALHNSSETYIRYLCRQADYCKRNSSLNRNEKEYERLYPFVRAIHDTSSAFAEIDAAKERTLYEMGETTQYNIDKEQFQADVKAEMDEEGWTREQVQEVEQYWEEQAKAHNAMPIKPRPKAQGILYEYTSDDEDDEDEDEDDAFDTLYSHIGEPPVQANEGSSQENSQSTPETQDLSTTAIQEHMVILPTPAELPSLEATMQENFLASTNTLNQVHDISSLPVSALASSDVQPTPMEVDQPQAPKRKARNQGNAGPCKHKRYSHSEAGDLSLGMNNMDLDDSTEISDEEDSDMVESHISREQSEPNSSSDIDIASDDERTYFQEWIQSDERDIASAVIINSEDQTPRIQFTTDTDNGGRNYLDFPPRIMTPSDFSDAKPITIGRVPYECGYSLKFLPENYIHLDSMLLNQSHCHIWRDQRNGAWYIKDNGSRNGTSVKGKRLSDPGNTSMAHRIWDGDVVVLGGYDFPGTDLNDPVVRMKVSLFPKDHTTTKIPSPKFIAPIAIKAEFFKGDLLLAMQKAKSLVKTDIQSRHDTAEKQQKEKDKKTARNARTLEIIYAANQRLQMIVSGMDYIPSSVRTPNQRYLRAPGFKGGPFEVTFDFKAGGATRSFLEAEDAAITAVILGALDPKGTWYRHNRMRLDLSRIRRLIHVPATKKLSKTGQGEYLPYEITALTREQMKKVQKVNDAVYKGQCDFLSESLREFRTGRSRGIYS